jgi:mono/diheme cytochrome c family protein
MSNKMLRIVLKSKKTGFASWLIMISLFISLISLSGCYYDDEETLYPQVAGCDTTNVTYSGTISAIMAGNCNSCHGESAPQAGIKTDNYTDLKTIADNEKLWGVVNHLSGYSPMPKDRPKLSDCDLNKIRIWIDGGALNN